MAAAHAPPASSHRRRMLMQRGCVQPALMPNIDRATARVLDAVDGELSALESLKPDELRDARRARFRRIGAWEQTAQARLATALT